MTLLVNEKIQCSKCYVTLVFVSNLYVPLAKNLLVTTNSLTKKSAPFKEENLTRFADELEEFIDKF